jgi:hypothetical protein
MDRLPQAFLRTDWNVTENCSALARASNCDGPELTFISCLAFRLGLLLGLAPHLDDSAALWIKVHGPVIWYAKYQE